MASNNEINSLLSSSNDKSMSKKHLNEHEETIKSDQMASKKSLSNDGEEQIASMDENDLKNLLDEALTYKNPRDANEKSETFKRLLQNVTEEEEHKRKFESNSLHWKAQSNSLQNLLDESHYQLQNHQSQISSKKHQQRRKNSTSVSTRRLEGGSLPVDMHHSSAAIQSPPDQPFLSEFKNNKKRKEKQQAKDTVIDMLDIETEDTRKTFQKCLDPNNKDTTSTYQDGMIELKSLHANRVEMEVQDQSSSKFTTANSTPNTKTTIASLMTGNPIPTIMSSKLQSSASTSSSVDQVIPFSTLEKPKSYQQAQTMDYYNPSSSSTSSTINHSNNIPLTSSSNYGSTSTGPLCVGGGVIDQQSLQLPSGIAVNSVMDPKTFSYPKYKAGQSRDDVSSLIQTTPSILPTSHSSTTTAATTAATTTTSNSKDSKASKKRTAKSERNEKNINVQSIEGYRGNDTLEELLTYIDGQHNNDGKGQKNHPKNGIVSNNNNNNNSNLSNNNDKANEQLLNADDKKKKMVSKNKEKMNKLKKSNSMDELCSTGRQQEKEKSSVTVVASAATPESSTANKIVQDVTLRSKNNANNSNSNSNMTSGAKKVENKTDKSQTKRNERRSWGTEGLWPDTSTTAAATNDIINASSKSAVENHDDNQENESSSSSSSSGVHNLDFITSDPINLTTNFESINPSSEADKFQVVIKKKKVKRKSSEHNDSKSSVQTTSTTTTSNNLQSYATRREGNLRGGTKSSTSNSNNNNNNNNNNYAENSRADKNNAANNKNSSKSMSQDAKQNSIVGKNRRKSTSSMPDEDGEYSDGGDSVQSLPIETTKPLSSLLSAPNNTNSSSNNNNTSAENSGKTNKKNYNASSAASNNPIVVSQISPSQQQQQQIISIQQQKPTTFSYADIAKTNTNRTNNNNNNNVIPASTEKMWPSISSSSSSTHQNNNVNNVNDPFAISSFDAISSRDNSNTNNNNNNNANLNSLSINAAANLSSSSTTKHQQVVVNQQQQQQQKATPLKNTMSFPDLVESNNNRNKQLNNSPLDLTFNGDATQTEKSLNGLERAFDNNNNPSTTATIFTTTHDHRLNNTNNNNNNNANASKISYSQSLLENHSQEMDTNGNSSNNINTKLENAITVAATVTQSSSNSNKNTLTKSKSVDHNKLSIEHYPALEKTKQTLSDVLSKPIVTKTNMIQNSNNNNSNNNNNNMMRAIVETTTTVKDDNGNGTKKKKDKLALKKSTSTVSTSTMASNQQYSNNIQTQQISNNNNIINNNIHHHHHHPHSRPAVIILNDCEKSSDGELGITFGFDINEHLLFGHQNGDAYINDQSSCVLEMNSTNKYDKIKNNSNCDIMNTNLSSNTINLNNNLTNQSCGFEIYDNFISSPPQSVIIDHSQQQQQQMIHQVTIIQSSPKINSSNSNKNNNNNSVKENTTILLDTSNQSLSDLGYMSSSLITNSTTSPANQKNISNEMQQHPNSDNVNQYENDYGHQTPSYPNVMDIKQCVKLDELVSRFVSPEPAKNFNYDELVTFVSEEWTKVERNGVYFNDDVELYHIKN